MAGSVTITLSATCVGGNHHTFSVTGAKAFSMTLDTSFINDALTDDEAAAVIKGLVKLGKVGRTLGQTKALFEAGVTVTI